MRNFLFTFLIGAALFQSAFAQSPQDSVLYQGSRVGESSHLTNDLYSGLGPYRADLRRAEKKRYVQSRVIIVDTRDNEKCTLVQRELEDLGTRIESFCEVDPAQPFRSITLHRPSTEKEMLEGREFSAPKDRLSAQYAVAGMGMMAFLFALPAEVTNWTDDKTGYDAMTDKYFENIRSGPVVDKDSWFFNYVAHPIVGGWYYTSARHAGLNMKESFKFSVLMSTFFWEYGFEALAEKPSIQDLLITPTVGSLFGEMFFRIQNHIEANGGELWGSKKLGKTVLLLVNPVEFIGNAINRSAGGRLIKKTEFRYGVIPAGNGRYGAGVTLRVLF